MKITDYFIKHPVSSVILNAVVILIGILCLYNLQIREYPDIKIPLITVETIYPNASAELVESSVTNILEDELAAIEGLDDIRSWSSSNRSRIMMKFLPKTSLDRSLIAVKDAIGMVRANLPDQIIEPTVERQARGKGPPFMSVCLQTHTMSFAELTHYVNSTLKNTFRSIQGISSIQIYGRPYTYKVTLDHQKMYNFGVNADEIYDSIAKGNVSLPAGKFQNKVPVTIKSELKTTEDFENILVKKAPNLVFLKDITDIELTEDNKKNRLRINGEPALCIGLQKSNDSNPLDISNLVHKEVASLKHNLPEGISMEVGLDQAEFIRTSLSNIRSSIIEAMFFVLIIVFIFLRNLRATIIPIITIPISLIGSLLFLNLFGFSINVMTLLAMVLAVGLVVDDAIVILENVTRYIEKGETILNAAIKGTKEIAFAVVAMTFTLTSVYIPIAFIKGVTGQLFVEFAAALAGSVLISGLVAITLSPLMCAKILQAKKTNLFPAVDIFLQNLAEGYIKALKYVMNYNKAVIAFFIAALLSVAMVFTLIPEETTPSEDRGLIGVSIPAIAGEDIDEIEANVMAVEKVISNIPEAKAVLTFTQDWGGFVVIPLKPIEERKRSADEIVNSFRGALTSFPSFDAWPWNFSTGLPGIEDPAETSELRLMISTVDTYQNLFKEANKVRDKGEEKKLFRSIYHNLRLDTAGYDIYLDKYISANLGIDSKSVSKAVSLFFSGDDSLKFKKDGILYSITIEGDIDPWTLDELYITNQRGNRISLGSFATLVPKAEPKELEHFNHMRAVRLTSDLTSGDGLEADMKKLYKLANDNLPTSYKKSWTGLAKAFKESEATMALLFTLSLLFIYAILAVQFESFLDPLIILFTVPLACLGALLALYLSGGTLNIYSQVGLITLIGLITKHGILIVEFANQLQKQGHSTLEAIEQAAALRLRPILMTTGAMLAGSLPLIVSSSYGFEARHAIGLVLFFGLGVGTIFTLFVLPTIYCALYNYKKR